MAAEEEREKEKANKSMSFLRQTVGSKSEVKANFDKNLSGSYYTQEPYKNSEASYGS